MVGTMLECIDDIKTTTGIHDSSRREGKLVLYLLFVKSFSFLVHKPVILVIVKIQYHSIDMSDITACFLRLIKAIE